MRESHLFPLFPSFTFAWLMMKGADIVKVLISAHQIWASFKIQCQFILWPHLNKMPTKIIPKILLQQRSCFGYCEPCTGKDGYVSCTLCKGQVSLKLFIAFYAGKLNTHTQIEASMLFQMTASHFNFDQAFVFAIKRHRRCTYHKLKLRCCFAKISFHFDFVHRRYIVKLKLHLSTVSLSRWAHQQFRKKVIVFLLKNSEHTVQIFFGGWGYRLWIRKVP